MHAEPNIGISDQWADFYVLVKAPDSFHFVTLPSTRASESLNRSYASFIDSYWMKK